MSNKKLFIVVNADWFFLSHRLPVGLAAKAAGWDVTVVTPDTGKLHIIREAGLKAIDLPMTRSGTNPLHETRTLLFLVRLYRRERPDVVHHVGMKAILYGTLAAKFCKIGGVVNAISGLGSFFVEENGGMAKKLVIRALKFSHKRPNLLCIFQNHDDWDMYVRQGIISRGQGRYIKGSGVDLHDFAYTPEPDGGKIKVIITARMIPEKGIFLLTEAAERLRAEYAGKVEFLLAGGLDDHPGAITREQLEQACDGDYIRWLGYRTDIKELLKQSHIVAFPSYYREGLPKSLIEADATGRPVITTDSVGCRDTVVDGVSGFLIKPKDVDALTDRLRRLIDDKPLRTRMGREARKYAEKNFDIEDVKRRHLEIYAELASPDTQG